MIEFIGLIKNDWNNIPANYRYVFIVGALLVILAWVGDHWGEQQQYHLPIFQNNEAAFQVGCLIMGLAFIPLLAKQIWLFIRIQWLRRKYPLKNLNQEFYLVTFREGWVYLFDVKQKRRLHVKNQQTAVDLGFLNEWELVDVSKDAPAQTEIPLRNGTRLILGDYKEEPSGIHTQGLTAT